jgi:hypothetical protein
VVRKERYPHQFIGSFLHQFDDNNKPWDSTTVPLPLFVSGFARIIQADLNFTDEDLNDIALLKDKLAEIRDHKLLFLCDLMLMFQTAGSDSWDSIRLLANNRIHEIETSKDVTWKSYKSSNDVFFLLQQQQQQQKKQPPPKHKFSSTHQQERRSDPQGEPKSFTCKRWNNGYCSQPSDHVTENVLWHHQCITCWKTKGVVALHKSSDPFCLNK